MFDFNETVVMITGATGGIGLKLAQEFDKRNAKLSLTGRKIEKIEKVAETFHNMPSHLVLMADLTDDEEIENIVEKTYNKYGRIDVLINCAGYNVRHKINEYSDNDWNDIFTINLKSIFRLCNSVSKHMINQKKGKIINISSIQSVICWPNNGRFSLAPYCASKAGVNSLTRSFALELAKYNINVNAICPSVVNGEWAKEMKKDPEIYHDIISRTPMGRLAEHDDILGPAMMFASGYSDFITGQCLLVDGGWTIE
jgi:gluconate 5-dehydrogenase